MSEGFDLFSETNVQLIHACIIKFSAWLNGGLEEEGLCLWRLDGEEDATGTEQVRVCHGLILHTPYMCFVGWT